MGKPFKMSLVFFFMCALSIMKANAKTSFFDEIWAASTVAKKVNPFIGTDGEGYTFPGAISPWGMASPSPHTTHTSPLDYLLGKINAPSGYRFGQPHIKGFGLTHLSGVGCPGLGAPFIGVSSGTKQLFDLDSEYEGEQATAGYYKVILKKFNTQVELTATERVGVFRFTFPRDQSGHIIINAYDNLSWGKKHGYIESISDTEFKGWSKVGNFCFQEDKQIVYFAARVNIKPDDKDIWNDSNFSKEKGYKKEEGKAGAWLTYNDSKIVELYVGLSYTSMDNALNNLNREVEGKDFKAIAYQTVNSWDQELGKIEIESQKPEQESIFYTALYHSLIHPNIVSDINGDFPLYNNKENPIGHNPSRPRYGVFSLWDTYRNLHSLLSLLYPKRQQEMLLTLEDMSIEAGHAPQWELIGSEVNMMVGDPALSVISEGFRKGFKFNDIEKLFSILYQGATASKNEGRRPGNQLYQQLGFIPHGTPGVWGAVSTTLEYSYHDWSLAQLAKALGYDEKYINLIHQSQGWEKLYDPITSTLRPKDRDGNWLEDFNPSQDSGGVKLKRGGPGYVEGNAYQYAYMVPHGLNKLIDLHRGQEIFTSNLQKVFTQDEFIMWNEPDIFYPYIFGLFPQSLLNARQLISEIRTKHYTNQPDGLPGNDDSGVLSSWFVFSALGFYPINPAEGLYTLGMPLFPKIKIKLDKNFYGDRDIDISVVLSSTHNNYFNNEIVTNTLSHDKMVGGGRLVFEAFER